MFVKKIKMKNNFKNLKNLPSNTNLKENFNYKKEIGNILIEKYLSLENNKDLKPFTIEEFNERIEKSLDDIKKGRVTSQDDLLIEISKWS